MKTRIVLVVSLLLLGACGDSGAESSDVAVQAAPADTAAPATVAPATTSAPATAVPETTTTTSVPPEPIEIRAVDYGFEGLPDTVPVGTQLMLFNESEMELHELVAILLPDDETRSAEELVQLPTVQLEAFYSSVETIVIAQPGENGLPIYGIGMLKKPGRYLVLCQIPIGADPHEYMTAVAETQGPPDVEGGSPHFAAGMYGEVTVEG